jgi:hypothetical protein
LGYGEERARVGRLMAPLIGWTVSNQEKTKLLRVGWRWAQMANALENAWVPMALASLHTIGTDLDAVLYESEDNAKIAADEVGGVVCPVRAGEPPRREGLG